MIMKLSCFGYLNEHISICYICTFILILLRRAYMQKKIDFFNTRSFMWRTCIIHIAHVDFFF